MPGRFVPFVAAGYSARLTAEALGARGPAAGPPGHVGEKLESPVRDLAQRCGEAGFVRA